MSSAVLTKLVKEYDAVNKASAREGGWFRVAYDTKAGRTDKFTWVITFKGPENYAVNPVSGEDSVRPSPYAGGMFLVRCKFPKAYPATPPEVTFISRVFHPNINSEGGICADDFKKLWKPQSNVLTVIEMLRAILANPNPDDPLELKPGELMKRDLEAFETKVREMISEDNEDSDGDDSGSGWDDDDDDE